MRRSLLPTLLLGALGLAAIFQPTFPVSGAPLAGADKDFLDKLRTQQLTRLLEAELQRLSVDESLSQADRIELSLELAGLVSERGNRSSTAEERNTLWEKADRHLHQFLKQPLGRGREALLRYRAAALLITRAERMHDLGLAVPADSDVRDAEIACAQAAAEQLENVLRDAEQLLNQPELANPGPEDLKPTEIGSLLAAARFRLGEAKLCVARSRVEPQEKAQAIAAAEPLLRGVLQTATDPAASFEARIALAELYRVAGRPDDALKLLADSATPSGDAARARSALLIARIHLESDDPEKALQSLQSMRENAPDWAEWRFTLFESLWKGAFKARAFAPGEANQRRHQAMDILDDLVRSSGNYWNLRGEALIAEALPGSFQSDDVSILERYARVLRNQGRLENSIATYDRAQEIAAQSKDTEVANRLQFEAGLTLIQAGEFDLAADRLLKLAESHPKDDRAPKALLAAAYAIARNYQKGRSNELLLKYRDVLQTHLKAYADDPTTAPEVHWLLAEFLERQKEWNDAVTHYLEVPPENQRFPKSLEAVSGIVHDRILDRLEEGSPETREQVQRVIAFLEKVSQNPPSTLKRGEQGQAALAISRYVLVRLLALKSIDRTNEAIDQLQHLVTDMKGLKAPIQAKAWELLLDLRLREGKVDDAVRTVTEGFPGMEANLIRLLREMVREQEFEQKGSLDESHQKVLNAACERLLPRAAELADEERRDLRLLEATLYRLRSDTDNEHRVLASLRAEFPRDRGVWMAIADCELRSGRYAESLKSWGVLHKGLPRGSLDWLTVVYHMIECHHHLGQNDQAIALYRATNSLYPDLGSDELRAKYHALGRTLGIAP